LRDNRDIFVPFRSFEDAPAIHSPKEHRNGGDQQILQISLTWMGQKPPFRTSKCCYKWMIMNVHPLNMENLIRIESYRYGSKAMNPWTHEPTWHFCHFFPTSFGILAISIHEPWPSWEQRTGSVWKWSV
jgi:hypothetical protein